MLKKKLARIISEIFNGFFTMLATPVLVFLLSDILLIYKIIFILCYITLPLLPYFYLKKLGKISDYEFTKREERPLYFSLHSLIFLLLSIASIFLLKNTEITTVTITAFIISSILTIITLFWKISGHMIFSTLLFFTLLYLFPQQHLLWLLFIFTPMIAWSRVELKKHTWLQTIAGVAVSAIISVIFFFIL